MEKFSTTEEWATNALGDMLSSGHMAVIRNLWQLLVKVNASTVLCFFRYRTGTAFINASTILWGYIILFICGAVGGLVRMDHWMVTGEDMSGNSSVPLYILFTLVFFVVASYRLYESRRNLRRLDGTAVPRYSGDTGLSHLWPMFQRLVTPFGLIEKDSRTIRWWQWNEYKFQKIFEPILIFSLGILASKCGYSGFGLFLKVGAGSAYLFMLHLEDNYFRMKQNQWDASVLSQVVMERDEPEERRQGTVVQQAIIRQDFAFDKWKKEAANHSRFERSDTKIAE